MLRLLSLPFLVVPIALAGCGPGDDPVLKKPCAQRGAASVIVGTGADDYVDPQGSVVIEEGAQGGEHIWIGLSCQGLGPRVGVSYGVRDVKTGVSLSDPNLAEAIDLVYDDDVLRDQAGGMYGYLSDAPEASMIGSPIGRQVLLWADVTDECHPTPIHGETQVEITGFDN